MADTSGKIASVKSELRLAVEQAQALGLELAKMKESAESIDSAKISNLEKQFTDATSKASALKDQINDTNEQIAVLTAGSKFEVLGNGISDVAGKIASLDFEGAAESANRLVQLSKQINFGDAVQGVKDIGSTFINLGKALLTNPLFLIAGAIALAVTYADELLSLIDGVSSEDEKRLAILTAQAEASKAQLDTISAQEERLKANGLNEEEILRLKIDAARVAAADAKSQIEQQKLIRDEQIAASERNKRILKSILEFVSAPLQLILGGVDLLTESLNKIGLVSDETFSKIGNLRGQLNEGVANLLFNPEEVAKEGADAIAEAEKNYIALDNQLAGFENRQKAIRAEAANQKKEDIEIENANILNASQIQNEALENKGLILTNLTNITTDALDRLAGLSISQADNILNSTDLIEDGLDRFKNKSESVFSFANDLNTLFAKGEETRAKKAFAINKAASLAQAIISTALSVNKAVASQIIPGDPTSLPRAIAAGVLAGVKGAAQVATIARTKFESKSTPSSSGGGGGSLPSSSGFGSSSNAAPITPAFNLFGQGNQLNNLSSPQLINANQQQPLSVNVSISETEITQTQSFVKKVTESAVL